MKTFLALLCFAFASSAQTLVWKTPIPISSSWNVTNSPVYPDGRGGGVILLTVNNFGFTRAIWFDAKVRILLTNDAPTLSVLRVTSKTIDLHTATETRRFQVNDLGGTSGIFLQTAGATLEAERIATVVSPTGDKRGFFGTQLSLNYFFVTRYSF
jgi:hypothetical protein